MDIGFALNYTNLYLIDITPDKPTHTWARLGCGITGVEVDDSDNTSDSSYYDSEGVTATDVTGTTIGYKFSGEREYNDPAQNYVASLRTVSGAKRKTYLRHINPMGEVLTGLGTITDIVDGGGDANSKGTFEFGFHYAGNPTYEGSPASVLPESITAADVTVQVGQTLAYDTKVSPATANKFCVFASSDTSIATVTDDGSVTGIAKGECEISLKSVVLPSVTAKIKCTVIDSVMNPGGTDVTGEQGGEHKEEPVEEPDENHGESVAGH